jgi:hypothetical protein
MPGPHSWNCRSESGEIGLQLRQGVGLFLIWKVGKMNLTVVSICS